MNFEPENYSKYTLRRFAALLDVICWVLIAVETVGICMFILSIVAKKSSLNLTIRICSFVNMHRDDCMKLCKRHMRCRMCLSYRL